LGIRRSIVRNGMLFFRDPQATQPEVLQALPVFLSGHAASLNLFQVLP
jgi:hypothetical protein